MEAYKKRILLVEDRDDLSRALKHKLLAAGFAVEQAVSGQEGLAKLPESQPDLIITDLVMPHGDGFEFLTSLKATNNRVPVIVLSNVSRDEAKKITRDLGIAKYFVKVETSLKELMDYVMQTLK